MRPLSAIACAALVLACRDQNAPPGPEARQVAAARAAIPPFEGRIDLARWIRGGPGEVGCWVEQNLGHRDPRWNCTSAAALAASDACGASWRAGPQLPEGVARRIHPLLRRVTLAWEHGALQSAIFAFDPDVLPGSMPRILGLGPDVAGAVAWHGPGQCDTPCYQVVVFEPGDDCEDGPDDSDE